MGFLLWTQERVRNSLGKRAISVQTIEVLLYLFSRTKDLLKHSRILTRTSNVFNMH